MKLYWIILIISLVGCSSIPKDSSPEDCDQTYQEMLKNCMNEEQDRDTFDREFGLNPHDDPPCEDQIPRCD